jgi:hypothetical protein
MFSQAGVDEGRVSAWSPDECNMAALTEVNSQAEGHPTWTTTQLNTCETGYVDGCLSAIKPLQGTA